MTKKILVPVDGSEQARKAIDFAANLAKQDEAVMHLLHVYKLAIVPEGMGSM
jgi:nucleotide-binding universal stress UspA family protein